ncbi:MAG: UDP-N-acetylmuramoyl-tripeptide--D-alanyl-D-alanine ligase, partial [Polaribacter sp.]|nr:UDP-N-acetylmuramoyl-tripeptide--D-alanyl-D-alanine ligase [Polaribacter sp.]
IIDEETYNTHQNTILVDDVLTALQELATYHRKQLNIPIIGITGTNGKTTSKELIKSVLNSEKNCYATKGNLNNHIGVPLSILDIKEAHDIAIIEMGANHQKEIEFLCNIANPTHGVITNIGSAHLEGFGNIQGVIDAKKELYQFIAKTNGLLFINSDDDLLLGLAGSIRKITYGETGDIKGLIENNTPFINIIYKGTTIRSQLIGSFQFSNIMLAICIGNYFNISTRNIKQGIESYTPTNNRSQIIETKNNTIILDAYNANPSSMQVALENFAEIHPENSVVILGDMFELGTKSLQEHQAMVDLATSFNFDHTFFVGEHFYQTTTEKHQFRTYEQLEAYLKENRLIQQSILIKGSRGMRLERILDFID